MIKLSISGKHIHSLEALYDQITRDLHLDRAIFGRNLDALYDVLSDSDLEKILITENKTLKEHLTKKRHNGSSEYAVFLDIITDLEGVEITILD
jgi:RNAse (barnase) inhibitor barstar